MASLEKAVLVYCAVKTEQDIVAAVSGGRTTGVARSTTA